jgi:hypothetical protein
VARLGSARAASDDDAPGIKTCVVEQGGMSGSVIGWFLSITPRAGTVKTAKIGEDLELVIFA